MDRQELKQYRDELVAVRPDDRLSDGALEALSAGYAAMQGFVVSTGLEEEYGSRKIYEKALDRLYALCRARCGAEEPLERRARMVPLLYDLLHRPIRVAELSKVRDCRERMRRLVREWLGRPSDNLVFSGGKLSETEYGILKCIARLHEYESEEERSKETDWQYLRTRLAELSEGGEAACGCVGAMEEGEGPFREGPSHGYAGNGEKNGYAGDGEMRCVGTGETEEQRKREETGEIGETGDIRLRELSLRIERACEGISSALQTEYMGRPA